VVDLASSKRHLSLSASTEIEMLGDGKLVAVRYQDKRLVKGWTSDFMPHRDYFHLRLQDQDTPTRVELNGMKAVFFLKTPGRNPAFFDRRTFTKRVGSQTKVWLEFTDGERLAGWSSSFASTASGFFLFPADSESNLEKAYVFRSAIQRFEQGEDADAASRAFESVSRVLEPSTVALTSTQAGQDTLELEASDSSEPEVGEYRLTREQLRSGNRTEED